MDSTVVDVARVDIVGDKGVIGEGTAIIKTSPDTSFGPNPVVGPSVGRGMVNVGSAGLVGSSMGGRMFDAAGGGIIGSGSGIVDAATTLTEQAFTGGTNTLLKRFKGTPYYFSIYRSVKHQV